jgi:4-amino-4-deoxy-L-arabinose transferase-like glycosyltransferase
MALNTPRLDGRAITRSLGILLILLAALTVIRLVGLKFSAVDLFFDEAQYWSWAQHPEFGYFSKPPLLAWLIAGSEHICGSSEACVRAPAPVLYLLIGLISYFIARRLYDERTAFWSGLSIALATGVVFSARIISTDVPLLLFWSLALWAYVELLDRPNWRWSILLGLAVGLGMLAKYAMVYFYIGVALTAVFDQRARRLLTTRLFWVSVLIALIVLIPNFMWIASHDFVTFRHTSDNIHGNGPGFRPFEGLSFLLSQFGVIGPITFGVFLVALVKLMRRRFQPADHIMIAFAIPPLALITAAAIITHYNANWAATAAISVTIVATAILVRESRLGLIYATIGIGLFVQTLFLVSDAYAPKISLPFLAKGDVYQRTVGWKNLAEAVKSAAVQNGTQSIVADQRAVIAELLYYLRDANLPIYAWRSQAVPADQFDMDIPLTSNARQPVLAVMDCPSPSRFEKSFTSVTALPDVVAASGPRSSRTFRAFKLDGGNGNQPFGPCW